MPETAESELNRALQPVRQYFHGTKVTPGTVLAAYLRAAGFSASGLHWKVAKEAIDEGMTFQATIELVADTFGLASSSRVQSSFAAPALHLGDPNLAPRPGNSRANAALNVHRTNKKNVAHGASRGDELSLEWFPKACGPGDIMGNGAKKLLGQPKLDQVSLLVRETAQNSWDARLENSVDFTINLRSITSDQKTILKQQIFTDHPESLGLDASLKKEELWAIEISDRRTKGLGGPVRNDLTLDPDSSSDFINLLFNIGAPKEGRLTGGTYGFGKTIGYVLSKCGTTLIWSRCKTDFGIEDRLIGSAIGDGYEASGSRFTGRHWWGITPDDHAGIEPALGESAGRLGATVFEREFAHSATGTSILILDPDLGDDQPHEYAAKLVEAVLWNLWPKMIPTVDQVQPMNIEVQLNGINLTIPSPMQHPILGGYVECLQAVRSVQSGNGTPELLLGSVEEVWSLSPKKLLGHLAMTRFALFDDDDSPHSEIDPLPTGSHHICLMRHSAELVVRYDEGPSLDQPGYNWAGVFRPVAATDDSFAHSEPPAHDDWVVESLTDRRQKSEVRVTFTRLRELARSFALPKALPTDHNLISEPTIGLARELGGILAGMGGIPESNQNSKSPASGRRAKTRRATVEVLEDRLMVSPSANHMRAVFKLVAHHPDGRAVSLLAEINGAVDGGRETIASSSLNVWWHPTSASNTTPTEGNTCSTKHGQPIILVIDFPRNIAIEVSVKVV